MNILIVEDEVVAARRLEKMILDCESNARILTVLDNALDATKFLSENSPELIFMDVQLADGICFEIFENVEVSSPIIFTTAHDDYMLEAFKVNSVDYLLKPIRVEDLQMSLEKFKKYRYAPAKEQHLEGLMNQFIQARKAYKCRFLVKTGRVFQSVDVSQIAYFLSENKLNFIVVESGKRYLVDKSLDQLEQILDPMEFYKINRNYILSNRCIRRMEPYFNNRMLLEIEPPPKSDVLVSRNHLNHFKEWMDK